MKAKKKQIDQRERDDFKIVQDNFLIIELNRKFI